MWLRSLKKSAELARELNESAEHTLRGSNKRLASELGNLRKSTEKLETELGSRKESSRKLASELKDFLNRSDGMESTFENNSFYTILHLWFSM